jgi:ABC-type multidrug transport system fused ATPase/permease subunit
MDEATSNVDVSTDHLIQKAIRESNGLFANSTVLTIAHRLNTVIDYDMILVLAEGEVVEYGIPRLLLSKDLEDPTAHFARMIAEMGDTTAKTLKSLVK